MRKKLVYVKALYIILLAVIIISPFLIPAGASAWSAIISGSYLPVIKDLPTHQPMLQLAYDRLMDDRAFKDQVNLFPDIKKILGWEGVYVPSWTSGAVWGAFSHGGPDASDKSRDSEHYYNPKTGLGDAPTSVKEHFLILLSQMYTKTENQATSERGAKDASWSAHFLADLHVPQHTVGVPADTVTSQSRNILSLDEYGSYAFWNPGNLRMDPQSNIIPGSVETPETGWGKDGNFAKEFESYREYHDDDNFEHTPFRDWFDPWYYNGITWLSWSIQIGTGSHAQWEKWANDYLIGNNLMVKPATYSTEWKNATPSFNLPFTTHLANQAAQAQAFSIAAATETREKTSQYLFMRATSANKAIERVATLWRASFTALRPSVEVTIPDSSKPDRLKVTASIGSVEPNDAAKNVQVKLTVSGGEIQGKDIQSIADPVTPTSTRPVTWEVKSQNPKSCRIKLEVICNYEKTPDLQYAVIEQGMANIKIPEPETEPVTDFNLSQYRWCSVGIGFHGYYKDRNGTRDWDVNLPSTKLQGVFSGNIFKGSGTVKLGTANYKIDCTLVVDADKVLIKEVNWFCGEEQRTVKIIGTDLGIPRMTASNCESWTGASDRICYNVSGSNTINYLKSPITDISKDYWATELIRFTSNSESGIGIIFGK